MSSSRRIAYSAEVKVHRASPGEVDAAYSIVSEYYEAVSVLVRDDRAAFEQEYFADGSGIWLATVDGSIVGCIGLHRLPNLQDGAEIKRLYVHPKDRGQGIAEALLDALEAYAAEHGYRALYLDSKSDLLTAIRFYQRHGYSRCERYNDNSQATIFMRKELH
jgi:ribosomal protein S18 acetylase RimI-like enzyme